MTDTKTPEMAMGDDDKFTITLSADQWQSIAAMQQYRLFAIHDLAERHAKTPWRAKQIATAICDLCRLPHADLRKAGLLK